MSAPSLYWTLIRLDPIAGCKREVIPAAKTFCQTQFSQFVSEGTVPDKPIQRQLIQWSRGEESTDYPEFSTLAQLCLRCFVSRQIEQVCVQLEVKFGNNHGFNRYDLFPFVLTDLGVDKTPSTTQFTSLATDILQTFDPERASLTTWTNRLVKQHRELNRFLLEQGVYLISDWAILNDTTPNQLSRIYREFHHLTDREIQQVRILLKSYHSIYRRDRISSNQTGQCALPTPAQLQQMADQVHRKTNIRLSPPDIMERLQTLAQRLRDYRVSVRRGTLPSQSLDDPTVSLNLHQPSTIDETEQLFLTAYRQQFVSCLDQAIQQVIEEQRVQLNRKKSEKCQQFIVALRGFHCQGKSMADIASLVGLKAQYQVSRLLKLKQIRAAVRGQMLNCLLECIVDLAKACTDPEQIIALDHQIEQVLADDIDKMIQEAEIEAELKNKKAALKSLFAQRICQYIDRFDS
jgi:hypothetical protein